MSDLSPSDQKLLKTLLEGEFITPEEAKEVERTAKKEEKSLAQAVTDLALMPDDQVGILVADMNGTPFVRVSGLSIAPSVLQLIPANIAKENLMIPVKLEDHILWLATNSLHQKELFQFLEKKTGKTIKLLYAARSDIKDALRFYEAPLQEKLNKVHQQIEKTGEKQAAEAISALLDELIFYAAQEHASDIHLEPQRDEVVIRMRIDGMLKDVLFLPKSFHDTLITRVKVLSHLRTDEHRAPQDGRIKMEFPDFFLTLRVSIIPIYDGEKVVLRLLASQSSLKLENLGYSDQHLKLITQAMKKSHGMILVTGPTGCGKTTTLYSVLQLLNSREVNISTIEDPVEIRLFGANQVQVNPEANLTFSKGLRSMLRQDPDIILVGEIRDLETANIAVNSALTGHLVFATLHTNDASSTLPRLLEMGVEHFLVASTVNVVIAQRLVRKICPFCIRSKAASFDELIGIFSAFETFDQKFFVHDGTEIGQGKKVTVYEGKGCQGCNYSGYKGRVAIAEFVEVDPVVRELIQKKSLATDIIRAARQKGMITMMEDGFQKVLNGLTTPEEVLRVTRE